MTLHNGAGAGKRRDPWVAFEDALYPPTSIFRKY